MPTSPAITVRERHMCLFPNWEVICARYSGVSTISSVQLESVLGAFFGHRNSVSAGIQLFDARETPFPTHSIFYRPVFRLLQWLFTVEPNNEPIHVRGGCAGDGTVTRMEKLCALSTGLAATSPTHIVSAGTEVAL